MAVPAGRVTQDSQLPGFDLIAASWTTAGACSPGPLSPDDSSPVPIRRRVEAARRAGFNGFGLRHSDLAKVERDIGYAGFRTLLDDSGISHLELEFLEGWYETGEARAALDVRRYRLLRAAEALGARHIKVGPKLSGGPFEPEKIIPEFAKLASEAANAGTKVGLEPTAFADLKTPEQGLQIVRQAGHAAGGLFLDIWHTERAGVDFASLADIPATNITGVELADASAEFEGSLIDDTFNSRKFPGEGDFDVPGFVQAIRRTGYTGPWGVEMVSTEFRKLAVEEAARRAFASSIRFLDGSGEWQARR